MPEVVEVRQYADFLRKHMANKKIISIRILNGRYKNHGHPDNFKRLIQAIPLVISEQDIMTKGKYLYIEFKNNIYMGVTLGLAGGWIYKNAEDKYISPFDINNPYMDAALKHLNVEFVFESSGSIFFHDVLSYGTIQIFTDRVQLDKKLRSIGPDIMDITYSEFHDIIKKKTNEKKYIGNIIVKQKLLSGIGNYLRSEILWLSRISPFRLVNKISEPELKKLFYGSQLLTWGAYNFKKAIKLKKIKSNAKKPSSDFMVYKKTQDIYNNTVIKDELYDGSQKRFIYWVKELQI